MRISTPSIVYESLGDEVLILDRRSGCRYGLDGNGARIWQLIAEGRSLAGIAESLGGDADTARHDVSAFCAELGAEGLLSIDGDADEGGPAHADVLFSARHDPPGEPGPSPEFVVSRRPAGEHGLLPAPAHIALLRAALLEGDAARAAFEQWRADVDFEALDPAAFRLLPLLSHNLRRQGIPVPAPIAERLTDAYRRQWYRMQHLLCAAGDVIARLSAAGIGTLVLKGLPLCLREYPSPATRPMSDVDVLVARGDASNALAVCAAAGWTAKDPPGSWPSRFRASSPFRHPSGWEVDLHTSVMHERRLPGADEELWSRSEPLSVCGRATRALAPDDLLLHVIAHGAWRNAMSPVRWAADAAMIVRRGGDAFDWSRFVRTAEARGLSLVSRKALRCLDSTLGVAIPRFAHASLAANRISWLERVETASHALPGNGQILTLCGTDWWRARACEQEWRGPLGFARYLAARWQLESPWQVPAHGYHRLAAHYFGIPPRDTR